MKSTIPFVDLRSQYKALRERINARIQAVLDHGQFIMGPEVAELEQRLAAYVGVPHCIAVGSGTDALLISLMAIDFRPGDEVITTPFTFAATAEVIALLGGIPVFIDVEPDTFNLDASLVEAAVTLRTRAIMPVSLFGQPADLDEVNLIAERHGLVVIEDAAQSFGATYRGRRSNGLSRLGCTSFFPSKPLGCYGDGGAIFTDDDALATAIREIRVHGQEHRYYHTRIGIGGRMDTIQCAVVLAKLEQFDWELERRQGAAEAYLAMLRGNNAIVAPVVRADRTSAWAQFTVQVDAREAVAESLKAQGIPTTVHYPLPLHRQPAYASLCRVSGDLSNAERAAERVLSLPMHPYLSLDAQRTVIEALAGAVATLTELQ
jgi:UDP-2-acetamido-2-deoxy-ribo-hexuluronate aminotransferase